MYFMHIYLDFSCSIKRNVKISKIEYHKNVNIIDYRFQIN